MTPSVDVDVADHIATVTFSNPPLNIITAALRPLMVNALRAVTTDTSVRCVILTGAGERSFCAGADLGEEADLTPETVRAFIEADAELFDLIEDSPVPVIAAVKGHCMGGGFELALSCDLRIVADTAKHCGPGVKVGLVVSTTRLTSLAGPGIAKDILLTGRTFDGAEAARLGIATRAVPADQVMPQARAVAEMIASRAPLAVRRTKASIHEARVLDYRDAMGREFDHFAALSDTQDHKHAIQAFFERRDPEFHGR